MYLVEYSLTSDHAIRDSVIYLYVEWHSEEKKKKTRTGKGVFNKNIPQYWLASK